MSLRLLCAAIAAVGLFLFATGTWATGVHAPVVPVVVVPATAVVVPPPAPPVAAVPPAAPAAPPPTAPAQQPAAGNGPGALGWFVFAFVSSFLGKVVLTHMAWCEEDDKKPANERMCYRPLRDGMPG